MTDPDLPSTREEWAAEDQHRKQERIGILTEGYPAEKQHHEIADAEVAEFRQQTQHLRK